MKLLTSFFVTLATVVIMSNTAFANEKNQGEIVIGADGEILSEEEQGVMQPNPDAELVPLIDQLPNAEVLLAQYNFSGARTLTSNYCTATQSHINVRVDNNGSGVSVEFQRRGPNESWVTDASTRVSANSSYTYNWNAVAGHDYRAVVGGTVLFDHSGSILCW